VVVMQAGRILQAADPATLYRCPADPAVAGFVGRGSLVAAERIAGKDAVRIGGTEIAARCSGQAGLAGGPVTVLLRPEALRLADSGLPATVMSSIYRGAVHEVQLWTETGERLSLDSAVPLARGALVQVAVADAWVVPD
jgi:iron(III) transport system ATP-binding protein